MLFCTKNFQTPLVDELATNDRGLLCEGEVKDPNACKVMFWIGDKNLITGLTLVQVQRETLPENCPVPPPIRSIIISGIGTILLIGILTLLAWKIATFYHDRREFKKFKKELLNQNWGIVGNFA